MTFLMIPSGISYGLFGKKNSQLGGRTVTAAAEKFTVGYMSGKTRAPRFIITPQFF
jgi:hypothetical protein